MDQENGTSTSLDTTELAGQMAQATQSLANAMANLDSQFAGLHAKIDRIIAAIDEGDLQASAQTNAGLQGKLAELEKANHDLKAQAVTARRKTLSPVVTRTAGQTRHGWRRADRGADLGESARRSEY